MCQCGCSEIPIDKAYELTRRCVLGVKIYTGCRECFPGLAVDLLVFDSAKAEWLEHAEIDRSVKPSQDGGTNSAAGIPIPIIDVESLRAQAREMVGPDCPPSEWETLDEWLADNGFELLQGAALKFEAKRKATK